MTAAQFCSVLKSYGFNFSSGVPCSILKDVIYHFSVDPDVTYIPATREDEALGIATGAYLAGRKAVVLMQNSGLGNSINALASLVMLYKIPLLLLISWRGYEGKDAPEHFIMGKSMVKLLENIGIPVRVISKDNPGLALSASIKEMNKGQIPVAIILRREVLE